MMLIWGEQCSTAFVFITESGTRLALSVRTCVHVWLSQGIA